MEIRSSDFHVDYSNVYRHWDPRSEAYAGGDALITMLQQGWHLTDPIYEQPVWYCGNRRVCVLHGVLTRGDEQIVMAVISNPFIVRAMRDRRLKIEPFENLARRLHPSREGQPA
jgi:hypothetical protein